MTTSLEWTFAYGSNMNVDDVRAWFVEKGHSDACIQRCARATLPGYRLIWNYYSRSRKGGAANVERVAGASLPGVAVQMNVAGLVALDRKEGHPKYYSRGDAPVTVHLGDGSSVRAWLYIAVPAKCRTTIVWPTREYLDLIVTAAVSHGLPPEHIEMLRSTPISESSDD